MHIFLFTDFFLSLLKQSHATCSSVFLLGQRRMFFTVYNWQVPHIFELIKYSVHIQESWNHLLQCKVCEGKNTDMFQMDIIGQ